MALCADSQLGCMHPLLCSPQFVRTHFDQNTKKMSTFRHEELSSHIGKVQILNRQQMRPFLFPNESDWIEGKSSLACSHGHK